MISYIIKIVLCSGILFLAYSFLLEKEKMHRFNRFFLLFSIAFSFLVPLITIEGQKEVIPFAKPEYIIIQTEPLSEKNSSPGIVPSKKESSDLNYLLWAYGIISFILLIRFSLNLYSLVKKTRTNPTVRYQRANLVLCEECPVPYSFLHYVFVDRNVYERGAIEEEILHHELAHIRQKHSLDILFIELISCFAWFNPFLFVYKRAIQLNHEFLADDTVIRIFRNIASYQSLLLNAITGSSHSLLTSSFNYRITKKRFVMMTTTSTRFKTALKQIILLPLLLALIPLFSTKLIAQQTEKKNSTQTKTAEKNPGDTAKPEFWVKMSAGYTKEGASEELMKEYQGIINKYLTSDSFQWKDLVKITAEDKSHMETIFKQMSLAQQGQQQVLFLKNPPPLPKVVPTEKQLANFKNAGIYGVWIDGKKVSNETLNKYTTSDFSQVFVSKLYGAAKKGRSYTHQVDLMTNDYYADYYKKAKEEEKQSSMVFSRRTKKSVGLINVQ